MVDFLNRISNDIENFTSSEKQIALFLLNNREIIAFETAASIANKLNISSVTVGRFCRRLGFKHFRDLKQHLRSSANLPWLAGIEFQEFLKDFNHSEKRKKTFEREIELLYAVYERSNNQNWQDAIKLIANCEKVKIIGFQSERGIATFLAHQLQYVRKGIELIDGSSGHFLEILTEGIENTCLIIIDTRRYSTKSKKLAKLASEIGLKLIFITDSLCDWAPKFTKYVLNADSDGALFWHSSVPMIGLINLLVNDVVGASGGRDVEQRLEKIGSLYEDFTGFVRPSRIKNI